MNNIFLSHGFRALEYPDHWACSPCLGAAFVSPAEGISRSLQFDHRTSSTAAKPAAIYNVFKYIRTQYPRSWTMFTDSKSSLQAVQSISKHSVYHVLVYQILEVS